MRQHVNLPPFAAWRHADARDGFKVVFVSSVGGGLHVAGHTAAVEHGQPLSVRYAIDLDDAWLTRSARV